MFRKAVFGHFLDVELVFNGLMSHYILLKEVEERRDNIIRFKLMGDNVSFGQKDFDIITR